jgi:hypothetical protein
MDNKGKQKGRKTEKNRQKQDVIDPKDDNNIVDDELILNLTNDILDKQYRLYSWADAKTASLIQTNSILLATIGFIFKDCLTDILATCFIFFAIIANVLSLFFCLRQVKPQRSSGKGIANEPNIRALSGILKIETWQDYHNKLIMTNKKQLYEFSARQIFGMARNTEDSRNNTTIAMKITLCGIAFLILSFISVSLTTNNFHLLGSWRKYKIKETPAINMIVKVTLKTSEIQQNIKSDTLSKTNK